MGEHLVARCEARHVLAGRVNDPGRFNPEGQRRPPADIPVADADELVPVADTGGAHRDHDLVRRGRRRRRELEHSYLAAERVDAGGLHASHGYHLRRTAQSRTTSTVFPGRCLLEAPLS